MNLKTDVAILGAGPAGLSAAYHLKGESLLIEKEDRVGGLARSKEIDGFVFDYAGHIFFTQDKYAFRLFKRLLGDNINFKNRDAWVYSKNIYTRYPFQANIYGLPKDVIMECIIGLIDATLRQAQGNGNDRRPGHFEDWINATFGEGIARHFMKPYNQKVWAFPLDRMTYEWIADRVMMPDGKEVLEGALIPPHPPLIKGGRGEFGPNSTFAYPLKGGSQAFADSFLPHLKKTEVLLNSEVVAIDVKGKVIKLKSIVNSQWSMVNREIGYEKLISSLPLPQLISLCNKVPKNVTKTAEELEFTSVYCVNLGINHPKITEKTWIYYPEKDIAFQRLFVQSNASPHVTPEGKSSVTAEISYSKYKKVGKEGLIERVIDDLLRIKFIQKASDIVVSDLLDIKYG
ncbi:MAG: FAD-dependent oxidoreductase, partial [Nitrospinae bacterium]|nr:FAD-dependent oxidoreductase [Nitrospinota bacterium]